MTGNDKRRYKARARRASDEDRAMDFPVGRRRGLAATAMCVVLAACSQPLDFDMRGLGDGFSTTEAARQPVPERPRPDNRGIISYPSYQVAVAQAGDSVTDVANRVGLPPAELASFNGVPAGVTFRGGEVLVLPRRVAEPSPATGAIATGPIQPGGIDVTTIASSAIDRAQAGGTAAPAATPAVQTGAEPLRHRVQRGETAFTIARLYNVTPRALADWNGLDTEFTVREGQYLLIPVAAAPAPTPAAAAPTPPGSGTVAPEPPSAATPLPPPPPPPEEAEAATPPSPELAEERTEASDPGQMMMPVNGSIIRPFEEGETDGIAISAPAGTPVRAARSGTVAAISRDTNGVPIVVVRHEGNLLTIYSQVEDLTVEQGDTVGRGDPIGRVRANDPPFLHFEVRQGFESVDPMPYLQ
jgi:murein DD-endopeptidase MepM/ murein hydrolase activator NlpD